MLNIHSKSRCIVKLLRAQVLLVQLTIISHHCSDSATYCSQSQFTKFCTAKHTKSVCSVQLHIHSHMALPFMLSVSQRASEGEEGACAGAAGQLYKRLAWRVMGWATESAIRPSFAPSDPTAPILTHPADCHPHPFHLCLYGIICILHWLCCSILRSFLSLLHGSRDNNKSSLLLDKDDLFSLSNQAITGWVHTQRTVLSLPLFICGYQLNEWVIAGCIQRAPKLGKNTNTPWFMSKRRV